jgi:hypothetical protein
MAGKPLVNLQVKTASEVLTQFEEAYAASECTTKGQFMEAILEAYLNPPKPKTVEVGRQEDTAEIQNLTNEIGRLKILIDQLKQECIQMNGLYTDAKQTMIVLEDELNNREAVPVIGNNQVIITIPPIALKVLEIEAITAKRKTGKEFSIEDVLINSFWESITVGRVYPWRAWSSGELSDLAKKLQSEAK